MDSTVWMDSIEDSIIEDSSNEKQQSFDSWGMINDGNVSKMMERTEKFKPSLLKMGTAVYNMIEKYNAQQSDDVKVLKVFISDGTLLGAFRNGRMIPHDYDMDFALYGTLEDLKRLYEYLVVELKSYNSESGVNYIPSYVDTYARKISVDDFDSGTFEGKNREGIDWCNVNLDIQLLSDRPGKENEIEPCYYRDDLNTKVTYTKEMILPLRKIQFEGYTLNAPANVEQYLKRNYGCIEKGAVYNAATCKYEMP